MRWAILDDGFQHRQLRRDLDIAILSARSLSQPPRLLPRGEWREPPQAVSRADLIFGVTKGGTRWSDQELRELLPSPAGPPIVHCTIEPDLLRPIAGGGEAQELSWLVGREVVALAGIGDPAAFIADLRQAGAAVTPQIFPDHHAFTRTDLAGAFESARGRVVITTGKDAVKLRALNPSEASILVLDQRVRITRGRELLDREVHRVLRAGGDRD